MDVIKTSPNVEFDVIYADGSRTRVPEGFLWEVGAHGEMTFHLGCSSAAALFTVSEALLEAIDNFGLLDEFEEWVNDGFEAAYAETRIRNEEAYQKQVRSDRQAVFRLGQMDMQQHIRQMLLDAADALEGGVVRGTLLYAADMVETMTIDDGGSI